MSGDPLDGVDEPTVVGYRPVAAPGRRVGASGGAAPLPDPPPRRPSPAYEVSPGRAAPPPPPPSAAPPATELEAADLAGMAEPRDPEDILAGAAAPLLALVAEIRNAVTNADVEALRRATVEEIRAFEGRALRFGARAGDVTVARYVLCAMLDETVMTTPWGNASSWSAQSLLNQFHGETWGGEKVFAILERLRADPAKYVALIKLISLCLAFGFEGRYRVIEGGRYQIDELRAELDRMLTGYLKPPAPVLSPNVAGVRVRRRLRRYVPPWVFFSVAAACLVALYVFFGWRLAAAVRPVTAAIDRIALVPVSGPADGAATAGDGSVRVVTP